MNWNDTAEQARFRAEVPVTARFSGVAEWSRDKYAEKSADEPNLGNFNANRYGLFVRWHP